MAEAFLLGRMLLRFGEGSEVRSIVGELSAAALGPDGALWLASDELSEGRTTLSRLSPAGTGVFADHRQYALGAYIDLFDTAEEKSEADIEGLDYADNYLWFAGSHSSKRAKPKGKDPKKDLERLAVVETEANRYLLGRIPLIGGVPVQSGPHPTRQGDTLEAARLAGGRGGNVLIEALLDDPHLGPFLRATHGRDGGTHAASPLASKENGFDIEGLAVFDRRLFLGPRGPVLRGWAMLLEIEPERRREGTLELVEIAPGKPYRKHFVDLDGLGVRELSRDGDDLLILAGPTMALDGPLRIYRLRHPLALDDDSLTGTEDGCLTALFDLPIVHRGDHAEGLTAFSWCGLPSLLVVYDGPVEKRRPVPGAVLADVFRMPG
jgi:Protein of unknown function (DUF3616)